MKSPWINIKKKLPPIGKPVDIWTTEGRMTNYKLIKNYAGKKGNDFFDPVSCGECCIRFNGNFGWTQATHWMRIPKVPAPKKVKK
jgi:hypothetical protein